MLVSRVAFGSEVATPFALKNLISFSIDEIIVGLKDIKVLLEELIILQYKIH